MEPVFKIVNDQLIQTNKDSNKSYKYTSHPITKEICYIELTDIELAQRQKDKEAAIIRRSIPAPVSLEERITALEDLIKTKLK